MGIVTTLMTKLKCKIKAIFIQIVLLLLVLMALSGFVGFFGDVNAESSTINAIVTLGSLPNTVRYGNWLAS